jgi:phenylalanyl-tRNA synthetase beta subunit
LPSPPQASQECDRTSCPKAVRVTLRHTGRTMVDEDMIPIREAIVARVRAEAGGTLRGG